MKSKLFFVVALVIILFISTPAPGQDEQITLSTYYPAPYGEYDELCAEKLLVDLPSAAELQDMARGDCHITNSLIVGAGGGGFSYDEIGGSLTDGTVLIKGNVGIGTTGPVAQLQIDQISPTVPTTGILINNRALVYPQSYLDIITLVAGQSDGNIHLGYKEVDGSLSNYLRGNMTQIDGRVVMGLTGNVGIGTTSPNAFLHIAGPGAESHLTLQRASSDNGEAHLRFKKSRGTIASPSNVQDNDWLGAITFDGWHSSATGWYPSAAMIYAAVDGAPSTNFVPGRLTFYTGTVTQDPEERMRIDNQGNVGIGTTSPGAKLEVNGTMKIFGTRANRVLDTIYQAGTDGFLVAIITYSGTASSGYIYGYADTSSSPTTIRASAAASYWSGIDYPTHTNSFTMPVRKDEYYRVARTTVAGTAPSVTIYWVPLGL